MAYLTNYNSMNVAADKGVCLHFQTKKQTGTWTELLDEVYVRGPKKGQQKTITHKSYDGGDLYNSIAEAWFAASDFKQVSSGRTHQIREVVIVDYDRPKDSNGNVIPDSPTFLEMIPKWTEICRKNSIPLPNYWVQNPLTKNGQFGWFVHITSAKDRVYINTVHKVNRLFDGDPAYTGWQCKNPYYDGLYTIWNNENSIIDIDVLSKITTSSYLIVYDNNKVPPTDNLKNRVKSMSKNGRKSISNKEGYSTSRNIYLRKYLTEYIWKWMRQHNGVEPDKDRIESQAFLIAKDAAIFTGKNEMETDTEIRRTMQSVTNWAVKKFRMPDSKKGMLTPESRNLAKLVRKCKKFIQYNEIIGMKGSTREIARLTGLSHKTVVVYRNMSEDEISDMNIAAMRFTEYLENDKVQEVKDIYINMYNQIKSIFSSFIDYDNNKVPPTENIVKYITEKNDTLPYETINDIAYTTEEVVEFADKIFRINGKEIGLGPNDKITPYEEQDILDFNEWVAYVKWGS